jgi:imidazole glycerol-phosphate synthase subunit HisH
MIVIVDYGMGNFGSVRNMLKKLGSDSVITSDVEVIAKADKIVLPGIGHFDKAMSSIGSLKLFDVLHRKALEQKVPCIGVCLGMQLMTRGSEEGKAPGLGWVKAEARRFDPARFKEPLRVPQMGWNLAEVAKPSPLFDDDGLEEHRYYFVHSYAIQCEDPTDVLCRTTYGYPFVSAFEHENLIGVQFHPEKSHKFGMSLFRRFIEKY